MTCIRLATYNIHGGVGGDGRFDIERIAAVINELGADLVALQEVQSRHGGTDVLEVLERATGLRAVAGPTLRNSTGAYGNAVLSRGSFVDIQRIDLSVPAREPRGALDVMMEFEGARLRVMATHLGLRPAERRHQTRLLLMYLGSVPPVPSVLMGDLNEWFMWGRTLRWLHVAFCTTPAPATFPSRFPMFALDRIWVHPRQSLRALGVHASAVARSASDHLPLVALLDL
jgi:endonuclease/exonuclease/phosphatase family metal-dependent hydrolase